MKKILYLCYYSKKNNTSPAAQNKVDYIIDTLVKTGYETEIVSAEIDSDVKAKGERKEIRKGVTLKTFDCLSNGNVIKRLRRRAFLQRQLKKYLKENLTENDKIVIYHSLGYYKLYKWIKKVTKAKILLETEEIYSDVGKTRFVTREKEINSFKFADGYIFPTELLDKIVNVDKKPSVIIHGTYRAEKECGKPFGDGLIHIVYAGTFDPRKGGVQAAAAAAEFLPCGYHVHILGFGTENDKKLLLKTIKDVSEKTECKVTFDGLKSGSDYVEFIQSCDIGLSTQNPDAAFNGTSFPSKILSYLSNGLKVVSIKIPAVEESAVGKDIAYYEKQTPEEIAAAIKSVKTNDDYDSRKLIKQLDEKFSEEIGNVLGNI